MEKEFVPYKLALKLKELGFNCDCFGRYTKGWVGDDDLKFYIGCGYKNDIQDYPANCVAPLWQQAFGWFRMNFNYAAHIKSSVCGYYFHIHEHYPLNSDESSFFIENKTNYKAIHYITYEEAREYCLEKLIEIVENSKQ